MQVCAYTTRVTPRIQYIFSQLLPALGISDYIITADRDLYIHSVGAKINYSNLPIATVECWVSPVALLSEDKIKEQPIDVFKWLDAVAFYRTAEGDFPFDIFAAAFYLVTRYEEYLPHKKDMYGRYAHENSLAYKEGFLKLPLVNIWLQQFSKVLLQKFPLLQLTPPAFYFLPTYDIDIAWSYLQKGWLRNLGGFINSLLESEWTKTGERLNVLFGSQKDPFFSYPWLNKLHRKYQLNPIYFFLLAERSKGYDKNISPLKLAMQKLVRQHAEKYDVGIHPSWQSGEQSELLNTEKKSLELITSRRVSKSRQHYIRLTLPDTYKKLVEAEITEDYSMGYGSINGYRASYCLPYHWYDLSSEQNTSLVIYPFCYMDANSFFEQRFNSSEALEEMLYYYRTTRDVGGLLITIWHNHFLGTDDKFKGWREVYEKFISSASPLK